MTENQDVPTVILDGVRKSYVVNRTFGTDKVEALKGLSLTIQKGEAAVLLGLNGAGKTTVLKLIAGLLFPDSGNISVFGMSPSLPEAKAKIGFLPELPYFPNYKNPVDALMFYGRLSGLSGKDLIDKTEKAIEITGLNPHKDKKIRQFSKGMMQRLGLAQAMLHNPSLILLDEPVSGLDPLAIRDIRQILSDMSKQGVAILMSSHSISEAEKICSKALIMKDGLLAKTVSRQEWEAGGGLEEIFIKTLE